MSSISGINATSNRIGGLVSGLNTDEIVEGMLANTQNKINKQYQNRQSIFWKQEAYRNIIRSVNTFTSKWFNTLNSKNNIGSPSFWNTLSASTTSKNFTVNASSGAFNGKITVDEIKQLASSHSLTGIKISDTKISTAADTNLDTAAKEQLYDTFKTELAHMKENGITPSVKVTVNGMSRNINFDLDMDTITTYDDLVSNVKDQLKSGTEKFFGSSINVTEANGELSFSPKNASSTISFSGSLLDIVGIENGASNKVNLNTSIKNIKDFLPGIAGGSFSFSINGKEFNFTEKDSLSTVMNKINSSDCGARMTYSQYSNTFKLTSTREGAGNNLQIEQTSGNLLTSLFGTKDNGSLSSKSLYNNINATNDFDLGNIKNNISAPFDISMIDENGKTITKTISIPNCDSKGNKIDYSKYTESQIANLIDTEINKAFNSSKFNVTISEGKFSINHSDGAQISISGTKGNNKMLEYLGFTDGATNKIEADSIKMSDLGFKADEVWTINGKDVSISKDSTLKDVLESINTATGKTDSAVFENGKIVLKGITSLSSNGSGMKEILGTSSYISVNNDIYATFNDNLSSLGVTEDTVLNIGGTKVTIDKNMSVTEMCDAINTASADTVKIENGKFVFSKDISTESGDAFTKLFGTDNITSGTTTGVLATASRNQEGQNCIITVNGDEIESFTNTVTVDGVEITATNISSEKETISVNSDIDETVKKIKEFMEDYNKLVKETTGKLGEKIYSDYKPLTDKQKEEMSEKEIEKWEEKAKSGVLKNDTNVNRMLSELRSLCYEKNDSGLALYNLGITTGDYSEGGQLKFADNLANGKSGEDLLREMLTNNPNQVKEMFTNTADGFAKKFKSITGSAVNTSVINRGYIANIAGFEGTFSDSDNLLTNEMNSIDKTIAKYKISMEKEEKRYWAQFTNLEKMISQMNAQSSWLYEQMG